MRSRAFHRIVLLLMLVHVWLPLLTVSPMAGATAQPTGGTSDHVSLASHESPEAAAIRQTVAAQAVDPEAEPVQSGAALAPGTITSTVNLSLDAEHQVFLPLIRQNSQAKAAVELTDLRTRYTRVFQRPDGSGYALSYLTPIHYQGTTGAWEAIDNQLIADPTISGAYQNTANDFSVQVAENNNAIRLNDSDTSSTLTFTDGTLALELTPRLTNPSAGQVHGSTITYPDVLPDVDLAYMARSNGIAAVYTLQEAPAMPPRLELQARVLGGTLTQQDDTLILAGGDATPLVFSLSAADTLRDLPQAAHWDVHPLDDGSSIIRITLDLDELQNDQTVYPLQVALNGQRIEDAPTLAAAQNGGTTKDAYAQSGYADIATGNHQNLYVGQDTLYGKGQTRIFISFALPSLPPGSTVTSARANLYQYYAQASSSYGTRVCRITQDWGEWDVKWTAQPNVTACRGAETVSTSIDWKSWNIKDYVESWYGGTGNYGILIQASTEPAPGGIYRSNNCSEAQCPGTPHPYMRVEYTETSVLEVDDGISFSPGTTVEAGTDVTASFRARNSGGASYSGSLRAFTNATPTFATQNVTIGRTGGTVTYQATQQFNTVATHTVCTQYLDGTWKNLPASGSGVQCRQLNIVPSSDVQMQGDMTLTPNELSHTGGEVQAAFTVVNTGDQAHTERFRAHVTNGTVTFAETTDITLQPGDIYTYGDSQNFTQTGVYEVIAERFVDGNWYPLIGQSSDFVRVKEPPPPPVETEKGHPPNCGIEGDPVNTATGNYFANVTDMSANTPGLPLAVTRWYNALDAGDVSGPFGYGSAWQYDMHVTWRNDMTALIRMADGSSAYFVGQVDPDAPLDMSGTYYGQGEDKGVLIRANDGSAALTMPDQTTYHFDVSGQIVRVSTPDPAEITVIYSGALPTQLQHSSGVSYDLTYDGTLITEIASSSGRTVHYAYNSGNLVEVTRPDGATYTYEYDANHRLTVGRTPNGHAFVENTYDTEGRVIRQRDQTGQESTFRYDGDLTGPRIYTDALGNETTHIYDEQHRLVQEIDARGEVVTYTYDLDDNLIARRDRNGALWNWDYDDQGNVLTETTPLGHQWSYTYDTHNNRTSKTDPLNNTTRYTYNVSGHLIRVTDPLSHTREYVYDSQGRVLVERDATGAETRYTYNAQGQRTTITNAQGNTTTIAYDAAGNPVTYTDAEGNTTHSEYDAMNRLVTSIDPTGAVITYTYDPMGNMLTESDGLGNLKYYEYDAYDRVIAETDFNGNTTDTEYDALGRRTATIDAAGNTTSYAYDALGNLTRRTAPDGSVTTFAYDAAGRLIRETDPLGRITEYTYDDAGQLIETRRPCAVCTTGKAVTQMRYDAAGRMIEEIDPRGAVTTTTYDVTGRAATITQPDGSTMSYTYDANGRTIQMVDPLGAITRYSYDTVGQLITTTNALGFQMFTQYDKVGRVVEEINAGGSITSYEYDASDRPIAITDALGNTTRHTYDAAGRLLTTTDPLSRTTSYTYDANGNQMSQTDPRGHTSYTEYDALNRPIRTEDALGNGSTVTYDEMGRVVAETDALGNTRTTTYDDAGRRKSETTPLGYTTVYTYDVAGNLLERQDTTGTVTRFAYDENGNQVQQIDALGRVQTTDYDLMNRVIQQTDGLGAVTENTYDAAGRLVATTDARGQVMHYEYDLLGRKVREISPMGHTRTSVYNPMGSLIEQTDARGKTTTYAYDALERQVEQTDALGNTRSTQYDAAGQVIAEVDYSGNVTRYTYDAVGNQVETIDAQGGTTTTTYDELNRVTSTTDPLGNARTTSYDALGRVTGETTPLGFTTEYVYNAEGWRTSTTDAAGNTSTTTYDAAGRPTSTTDALGRVTRTQYDAAGQMVTTIDPLDRTTRYRYDRAGRLMTVIAPDDTRQAYTYDPAGNILTDQDGNGHTIRYEYDADGRLVRKTDPLGHTWLYRYDSSGNQTGLATPAGHTITQDYDDLGRLVSTAYNGTTFASYAYDANGNRTEMTDASGTTSYTYDALNRLVSSSDADNRAVAYAYDAAGQRTELTYPDGIIAKYTYDADGRLNRVAEPGSGATTYTYDEMGRTTRVVQANGVVVESAYDAVGNLTSLSQRDPAGTILMRQTYTLDDANRRTQERETLPQGDITTDYTYDALDRLVHSVASDGHETRYTFDNAGNRIAQEGTRGPTNVAYRTEYDYNAANQLVRASDSIDGETFYTYDVDGYRTALHSDRVRASYAYDVQGRMTEARVEERGGGAWVLQDGTIERYAYDGDGRRISREIVTPENGAVVQGSAYRYDDISTWNVLYEEDTTDSANARRYLYDRALHKLAVSEDGQSRYFQSDSLGSVLGATDASGSLESADAMMRYGDYGELLADEAVLPTADAYTGYEQDSYTGLSYARHRYYDAATGTFLTPDPYPTDRQDMLNLHRYLYVQANPINMTDPLGLFSVTSSTTGLIEQGDTLSGIAFYELGTSVEELQRLNPFITDPDYIQAGWTINIPHQGSAHTYAQNQQQNAHSQGTNNSYCGNKGCGSTYIVQTGDSLSGIGSRLGVNWQWIQHHPENNKYYNLIGNPHYIDTGWKLYIPCSDPRGGGDSNGITNSNSIINNAIAHSPSFSCECKLARSSHLLSAYPLYESDWRTDVYSLARVVLGDNGFTVQIFGSAIDWTWVIFPNTTEFSIRADGDFFCSKEGDGCEIDYTETGQYSKQDDLLTLAVQADIEDERDTLTARFNVAVGYKSDNAIGAGIGPFSINLSLPNAEKSGDRRMGFAKWECHKNYHDTHA